MRNHRCFVIQPFDCAEYDERFDTVLLPAILDAGLLPYRVDRNPRVDLPTEDIEAAIRSARVCLADITTNNPNVWFEVGYALACQKRVCLICGADRVGPYPFDVRTRAVINYRRDEPDALQWEVTNRLRAIIADANVVHFEGEAEQLLTIFPDGSHSSEKDGTSYRLMEGEMSQNGGFSLASSRLLLAVRGMLICGQLSAQGPVHNGYAYWTYDAVDSENRQHWKGLCLLKLSGFGNFVGYWMTESNIVPGTLSFGRMILQRVIPASDDSKSGGN
jgi:hypothetical protein